MYVAADMWSAAIRVMGMLVVLILVEAGIGVALVSASLEVAA